MNGTPPADTPFVLLGGTGAPAHLAPANGFPPQVYLPLVDALGPTVRVKALIPRAMRATEPPPPDLTWHTLADEMAAQLLARGWEDLIGIGHSLGGVMTLLAAVKHPGLFRCLVLMDPVIFPQPFLWVVRIMRGLGLKHRLPLVRAAQRRRRTFPDRERARARYARHPFFRNWHPAAFDAYIRYGLREREEGGVELAYAPEWEAAIFASVPADIWRWVPQVRLPVLLLYGEQSDTLRPAAVRRLRRAWPHARIVAVNDAGHMFPMEKPEETARLIQAYLETMCGEG